MKNLQRRVILSSIVFCFSLSTLYAAAKNPDTFTALQIGNVRTLDPGTEYDTRSDEILKNIYETLLSYDSSFTDKYIPTLASEVPTLANGGISNDGLTYTLTIRGNVTFHKGQTLTPDDVVYSIKRCMILDQSGGPSWMLLEALTNSGSTRDDKDKVIPGIFEKIDKSVEAKGNKVIFHLPKPYPPFIQILCHSSASIVNKQWTISQKCWDGDIATAARSNNPPMGNEALAKIANGTGPYTLKPWVDANNHELERFDGYWGKKPAIKSAVFKMVNEWSTRKLMLQNGDADFVYIDEQYLPEVQQLKGVQVFRAPGLAVYFGCFCLKINPSGNPNIGSGKLDGKGIPPDFFTDSNVRKAFLHSFNHKVYLRDVFNDNAITPSSPVIQGLAFHKDVPLYEYDLKKAQEYFQKAWSGQVWEKGFVMTIAFNSGNVSREQASNILADALRKVNKKFVVEVRGIEWKDYLVGNREGKYPISMIGWSADYPDAHNFVHPFLHPKGVYGLPLGYRNPELEKLIDDGIMTIDPKKREMIYSKIQDLFYSEALALPLYQVVDRAVYRDWIKGIVLNPLFPLYNFVWKYSKQ